MSRKLTSLHRTSRVRADLGDQPPEWYRIIRNEVVGEQTTEDTATRSTADVYVYESIGGWFGMTADDFVRDVAGLDVDHIDLHLNSPGGDVFEGVAMANVLRQHRADITVWVDGLAASAASVVAMAGDEIVMGLGAQFMIHDASTYAWGNAADVRKTAEVLDSVSDSIASTYAARAGGTAAEWRAVMVEERWYTGEQAVTAGLANRVAADEDKGRASGDQVVPGSSSSQMDWWDSASDPTRHAATVAIFSAHADRLAAAGPHAPAASAGGSTPTQEGAPMPTLNEGLRQRLGIADDADEATILAALDEALTERAEPTATTPPGTVLISASVLTDLQAKAQQGVEARQEQQLQHRQQLVSAALADGRIKPTDRDTWLANLAKSPEVSESILASLPSGAAVPTAELGTAVNDSTVTTDADALYQQLYPEG